MAQEQTRGEERLNVLTHGSMALAVLAVLPWAVWRAGQTASLDGAGVAIFCLCLFLMFGASTLYHGQSAGSARKRTLNRLDHMAIFFAIAGSYTPIALSIIGGTTGKVMLILEWSLVLVGVLFKVVSFKKNRLTWMISILLYLLMGWALVICLPLLIRQANPALVWLILIGGLLYTGGLLFFAQSWRYAHVVWHFFVNGGAICHFTAIVFFLH